MILFIARFTLGDQQEARLTWERQQPEHLNYCLTTAKLALLLSSLGNARWEETPSQLQSLKDQNTLDDLSRKESHQNASSEVPLGLNVCGGMSAVTPLSNIIARTYRARTSRRRRRRRSRSHRHKHVHTRTHSTYLNPNCISGQLSPPCIGLLKAMASLY